MKNTNKMNYFNNKIIKSLPNERWVDIEPYGGCYQISSLGRVKAINIMTQTLNNKGRLVVTLSKNKNGNKNKGFQVSRLVAKAFCKNPLKKTEVNHKDGDHKNNKKDNLEWNTRRENNNHAMLLGLKKRGEKHPDSKLSEKDVIAIFNSQKQNGFLAKKYGISPATVSDIWAGRNWGWLTNGVKYKAEIGLPRTIKTTKTRRISKNKSQK